MSAMRKKSDARPSFRPTFCMVTAVSTDRRPKSVVNLITGFRETEEVSLNGSPTVSPTTEASCSGVFFCLRSPPTSFWALSQQPPALAMKIAWKRPKKAMPTRADEEVSVEKGERQGHE